MKLKKDSLRKRLHAAEEVKKEEKLKAKRQKTAVVGDLKPMADTLKAIDDIIKLDEVEKAKSKADKPSKKAESRKVTPRQKKVQEKMLKDMNVFSQVLQHPQYVSDPFKTISTHIENKMLLEAMQE